MNVKRFFVATVFAASVAVGGAACTSGSDHEKAVEKVENVEQTKAEEFNAWSEQQSQTQAWEDGRSATDPCVLAASAEEMYESHPEPPVAATEYNDALESAYAVFSEECTTGVADPVKAEEAVAAIEVFYLMVSLETDGEGVMNDFAGYETYYYEEY